MTDYVVDACCLISLYASGRLEAIVPACGGTFYVSQQVQAEALSVRQPDPNDSSVLITVPIDVADAASRGIFRACRFESEGESAYFVEFATTVDDGEASCLAVAKSRGWALATDDRKAIRLASDAGVLVITTPELGQRWADVAGPAEAELIDTIRCIERFAKFRPRRNSAHYEWWTKWADSAP